MRLHTLLRMYKHPQPLKIHRPTLRKNMPFNPTSRPEIMEHPPPRLLRICPKIAYAIFANFEPRRYLRKLKIDNARLVDTRLDRVALPILADIHGAAVGLEVLLVGGEGEVGDVVGAPEVRFVRVWEDDL